MTYHHGNHFLLNFFLIIICSLQACINPWLPIWCHIAMETGRSETGLLTTPHIPASWGAVSCEGEPNKGQGLPWGLSSVPGEKVLKTLLLLWLQDVKVGGVIRASNRGDVGWENWREREWGLPKVRFLAFTTPLLPLSFCPSFFHPISLPLFHSSRAPLHCNYLWKRTLCDEESYAHHFQDRSSWRWQRMHGIWSPQTPSGSTDLWAASVSGSLRPHSPQRQQETSNSSVRERIIPHSGVNQMVQKVQWEPHFRVFVRW